MILFSYRKPPPIIHIIILCLSFTSSAQYFAEPSKWDELLALEEDKTKLIFSITEECTSCFSMFKYVDYLNQHKRDDVEVYVMISKRNGSEGNSGIMTVMRKECEAYDYGFLYYFTNDGGYENASFNKNPHTYIIDHKKLASEVHHESSKEHKEAILRYVNKDAQKTIDEIDTLYASRISETADKVFYQELDELLHDGLHALKKKRSLSHVITYFIKAKGGMDKLSPHMRNLIEQSSTGKELTEKEAGKMLDTVFLKVKQKVKQFARQGKEKKTGFVKTAEALAEYKEYKIDQKLYKDLLAAIEQAQKDTLRVNKRLIVGGVAGEKEITQQELDKIAAIVDAYNGKIKVFNKETMKLGVILVTREGRYVLKASMKFKDKNVGLKSSD